MRKAVIPPPQNMNWQKRMPVKSASDSLMGLRPESELRKIEWEHFDWERGYLHVAPDATNKVHQARYVPIPANVKAMLCDWLGAKKRKGKISGRMHVGVISKMLRDKDIIKKWPIDVMRHNSISYMLASGESISVVAERHGNSADEVRKPYRRPLMKQDADQWYNCGLERVKAFLAGTVLTT